MCDHRCHLAFKESALGNMHDPFFQHNPDCRLSNPEPSDPPFGWQSIGEWTQELPQQETPSTSPASPRDWQQSGIGDEVSQHDHEVALELCADGCVECDDPSCDIPDCEADMIPCSEEFCSKPQVEGGCHGNKTVCLGNLPQDVLSGAASLAALQTPSMPGGPIYSPQPQGHSRPPCEALAGHYYNPQHIHAHIPNCGPHGFASLNDPDIYSGDHHMMIQMVTHPFEEIDPSQFNCGNQDCEIMGMSYNDGAQAVANICEQHRLINERSFIAPISAGPQPSLSSFSLESTPSTATPFSASYSRELESTSEQILTRPLSATGNCGTLPTCLWEVGHDLVCGLVFDTAAQLQNHIQEIHTSPLRKAHGFNCRWKCCSRREKGGDDSFAQRSKLDRHIQSHTGYKASVCTICGLQFSTTQSLVLHQRTHSGEKPHKCPVPGCGYAAAQASQLTMHNRTKHTKEKPLKCDFPGCNACFAESSNLSKHKKIHLPEAPCSCQLCFKSFNRDDQLKRHMKTHTKKAHEERERNLSVLAAVKVLASQEGLDETPIEVII